MKRKLSRLTSIFLSVAMVFTSVNMPAYAAEMEPVSVVEDVSGEAESVEQTSETGSIEETTVAETEEVTEDISDVPETESDEQETATTEPVDTEIVVETESETEEELEPVGLPGSTSLTYLEFNEATGVLSGFSEEGKALGAINLLVPKEVTKIANGAFKGATSILSVYFEDGTNIAEIGESAFEGCSALTELEIPTGVTTIGYKAFRGTGISEVTLPSTLENLGAYAFYNCSGLNSVTILSNKIVTGTNSSAFGIFEGCSLKSVSLAAGMTKIPDYLFYKAGFYSGTTVTIPAGVTLIDKGAFKYSNVAGIVFEEGNNLSGIGESAFEGCSGITSFDIPAGVTSIGYRALSGTGISEITLPANLVDLGAYAFYNCSGLNSVTILSNKIVTGTNSSAFGIFEGCSLESVSFGSNVKLIPEYLFYKAGFQPVKITIPSGITKIDKGNFRNCTGWMRELVIPSSVTTIGEGVLKGGENYVTLSVIKDSYAHKWASRNGFTVSLVNGITYNLNGGKMIDGLVYPVSYESGKSEIVEIPVAQRTGYTFDGWFYDQDFKKAVPVVDGKYDIHEKTGAVKLFAKWAATTYTISFEENKPETSVDKNTVMEVSDITAKYDKAVVLPVNRNTVTKYTFAGWNTSSDGSGTKYLPGATVKNLVADGGSITLYGQWKAATYTIKYDSNSGNTATGTMKNSVFTFDNEDNTLRTNTFVRKGYAFAGWTVRADGKSTLLSNSQKLGTYLESVYAKDAGKVVTLYASWFRVVPFTMVLYKNDGVETDAFGLIPVGYGEKLSDAIERAVDAYVISRSNLTRAGYKLSSWNTKPDGSGKKYSLSAVNIATGGVEVELYAQWTPVDMKITYSLDGGKNNKNNPKKYKITSPEITLKAPVKTGYTFIKWVDSVELAGLQETYTLEESLSRATPVEKIMTGSTGDKEFVAVWRENTYTVKYHINSSANSDTEDFQVSYGYEEIIDMMTEAKKVDVKSEKAGQAGILAWNTKANGKGKSYSVGKCFTRLSATQDAEINLYAQWGAQTFRITYNTAGGTNNKANSGSYAYNADKAVAIKAPARPGYIFSGWAAEGEGAEYFDPETAKIAKGARGDITLVASWTPITYTVKFDKNTSDPAVSFTEDAITTFTDVSYQAAMVDSPGMNVPPYLLFYGCTTKPNGKGISRRFIDGRVDISGLTTKNKSTVTLYAKWVPVTYNIEYRNVDPFNSMEVLEGVKNTNPTTYRYNAGKAISLKNPTCKGFVFKGWYEDSAFTKRVTSIPKKTYGDRILYGKWELK